MQPRQLVFRLGSSSRCRHHSIAIRSGPSARTMTCSCAASETVAGAPSGKSAAAPRSAPAASNSRNGRERRLVPATRLRPLGAHAVRDASCAGMASAACFGNMRILRQVADDAPPADPRGQAVDQLPTSSASFACRIEPVLTACTLDGAHCGQADQIEAETRIERIGQRIELFARTGARRLRPRDRLAGLHRDRLAPRRRCGRSSPPAAARPCHAVPSRRSARAASDAQRQRDRLLRWRPARQTASRPYNPARACAARSAYRPAPAPAAGCEVNAAPKRAAISAAARAATSPMVFNPARCSPRMIFSSAPSVTTGNGATAAASAPQATIRPWACRVNARAATAVPGNAPRDDKALPRQRIADFVHHRGLAAEQMRAAGDVEQQTVRADPAPPAA